MNIVLAEPHEVRGVRLNLSGRRAEHIVKVLRSEIGDIVKVGIIGGKRGYGVITALKKKYPFQVNLDLEFQEDFCPSPPIDLILAMPRPIMLRRILSQVTALGVGDIYIINANRVEKSFWQAGLLEPEEYRDHLIQGMEQAVDTFMPKVHFFQKFRPFIEDFCPTITGQYSELIVADPAGERHLVEAIREPNGRVLLAVGPEGGWVDFETEKFQGLGFSKVHMGQRILKVDTAVIALHAAIMAIRQVRSNCSRAEETKMTEHS